MPGFCFGNRWISKAKYHPFATAPGWPARITPPCFASGRDFGGKSELGKHLVGLLADCLDPGGFGAVTITKSITIDYTGTFGSILASGTNGVNIAIAVNADDPFRTVRLRSRAAPSLTVCPAVAVWIFLPCTTRVSGLGEMDRR